MQDAGAASPHLQSDARRALSHALRDAAKAVLGVQQFRNVSMPKEHTQRDFVASGECDLAAFIYAAHYKASVGTCCVVRSGSALAICCHAPPEAAEYTPGVVRDLNSHDRSSWL